MRTKMSPMTEKANDIKENLSELKALALDAAKKKVGQMHNGAKALYAKGRGQAKSVQTQAENYIREEPIKALLIAAAAGLTIGWLLTRSKKSNLD